MHLCIGICSKIYNITTYFQRIFTKVLHIGVDPNKTNLSFTYPRGRVTPRSEIPAIFLTRPYWTTTSQLKCTPKTTKHNTRNSRRSEEPCVFRLLAAWTQMRKGNKRRMKKKTLPCLGSEVAVLRSVFSMKQTDISGFLVIGPFW